MLEFDWPFKLLVSSEIHLVADTLPKIESSFETLDARVGRNLTGEGMAHFKVEADGSDSTIWADGTLRAVEHLEILFSLPIGYFGKADKELTRIGAFGVRRHGLSRGGRRLALLIETSFLPDRVVFQLRDIVIRDRKPHDYLAADFVLGAGQP